MDDHQETLEGAVSVLEHGQALEVLDSATTEQAAEILRQGTAENTLRAREADARYFWTWADVARGLEEHYPISGDLMVLFITQHLADGGLPEEIEAEMVRRRAKRQGRLSVATVQRRVSTLSSQHRVLGLGDVNPARGSSRRRAAQGRAQDPGAQRWSETGRSRDAARARAHAHHLPG